MEEVGKVGEGEGGGMYVVGERRGEEGLGLEEGEGVGGLEVGVEEMLGC